jgi:hypothetical protein
MVFVASNKEKRLLYVSYLGRVTPAELSRTGPDLEALAAGLPSGFRLLVDLTGLDAMELECLPEIGRIMEMLDRRGVDLIVRVVPDPAKDIGLSISTIFHYPQRPQVAVCKTMSEAGARLGL